MDKLVKIKEETIINIAKSLGILKFKDNESLTWEERFKKLEEHHRVETQALYEKIFKLENHPAMNSEYWPDEMFSCEDIIDEED